MNAPDADSVPRLKPGMRLRFDEVRQRWTILAPERMYLPDEQAVEVLQLIDGVRNNSAIALELALRYAAAPAEIEADIATMLGDLAEKGVVCW